MSVSTLNPFVDFETYFAINRLYEKRYQADFADVRTVSIGSVVDILDEFDAVVLDSWGVLNSEHVIEGALGAVDALRAAQKKICILSNDGNSNKEGRLKKYTVMGFTFEEAELVNGLDLLEEELKKYPSDMLWGGIYADNLANADLLKQSFRLKNLAQGEVVEKDVDGFILFTAGVIEPELIERVAHSLKENPRPFLVPNPDIASPHPKGLYITPGYFSQKIEGISGVKPVLLGKPDPISYKMVMEKLSPISPDRILMVGDTLHTDILGGRLAGMKTMLVSSGVYKGRDDIEQLIKQTGIVPDYIAPHL